MLDPQSLLRLAERVALAATECDIATALVGAAALAVHGRVRATKDVDLAVLVSPDELRGLETALQAQDLRTRMSDPVDDDPLGGVLRIWLSDFEEDGDPVGDVAIVNFFNPHHLRHTPARDAIPRAVPIDGTSPLRAVTLPDMVAFKLYAGSRQDHADIVELLVQNPNCDLDMVRTVAAPFDCDKILEQLIAEAATRR